VANLLSTSRTEFLAEVRRVRPESLREIEFDAILDSLVEWSMVPGQRLRIRPPGKQQTVSFVVEDSGDVLWAAYPSRAEGAKVVVLPQRFRRLADENRARLLNVLEQTVPRLRVNPGGYLQVPLHRLASDHALATFLKLLGTARLLSLQCRTRAAGVA
jgi:hypothetical protein